MKKTFVYLLLGYSILASLFLVKHEMILSRSEEDKNYKYEWNFSGNTLSIIHKQTNKLVGKWRDLNYDFNYETSALFSRDGKMSTIYEDENEDGFFEKATYTNSKKELISEEKDSNNDGIYEEISYRLANGERLFLRYDEKLEAYEIHKIVKD